MPNPFPMPLVTILMNPYGSKCHTGCWYMSQQTSLLLPRLLWFISNTFAVSDKINKG